MDKMTRIAIVPAAGYGRRLGSPAQGKELVRVPGPLPDSTTPGPVIDWLLRALETAKVGEIIVVSRPDKTELELHLRNTARQTPQINLVHIKSSPSVPHTLLAGLEHAGQAQIAFGFPDMLFRPMGVFDQLFDGLTHDLDAVLGICPASKSTQCDRVLTGPDNILERIYPKPLTMADRPTWISAVWNPTFSEFVIDWLEAGSQENPVAIEMAELFNAAISSGLQIAAIPVPDYRFLDIGTADSLARAAGFVAESNKS
jgi:dTDP-glucose pyrophosphorylase